jgi:amino acid transporter
VATLLSIVVGALFYDSVIAVVAFAAPWTSLMNERYATILALQQAVGGRAIVNIVLVAALISLFKVLNGAFVASTRLLFAMSKRGLISSHIGKVHPVNRTPAAAVLLVGAITFAAVFFGDSILIPMIEVGALGSAFGWTMASAAYFRLNSNAFQGRNAMIAHTRKARLIERIVSAVGLIVGGILILMKVLSFLPGHLTFYEYVGLVLWLALGASLYRHQAVTGLNSARSSTL